MPEQPRRLENSPPGVGVLLGENQPQKREWTKQLAGLIPEHRATSRLQHPGPKRRKPTGTKKNAYLENSLVVQWLKICLPMKGVWVRSLVGEVRAHMPCGTAETFFLMPTL